jgi:hypothetical protein
MNTKFFDADPGLFDPGSEKEKLGSGIRYKYFGSATLIQTMVFSEKENVILIKNRHIKSYQGHLGSGKSVLPNEELFKHEISSDPFVSGSIPDPKHWLLFLLHS